MTTKQLKGRITECIGLLLVTDVMDDWNAMFFGMCDLNATLAEYQCLDIEPPQSFTEYIEAQINAALAATDAGLGGGA